MAELAAGHAGRQRVVGYTNRVILIFVRKGVVALGHGTNEDADALLRSQVANVVSNSYNGCVKGERHLSAIGWQVIGDWILNDLEQFLLRRRASNGQLMEKLHHQTGESLEGTWDTDGGRDFDEDTLCSVDVDLQLASLVDRRVEQGE